MNYAVPHHRTTKALPVHKYPFSFDDATFPLRIYGFRPHVSDENDQWKRNFSKTLFRVELFENACFSCMCGQTKTELWGNTISSNPLRSIFGLISNLIACFQVNLALLILRPDYSRRGQNITGYFRSGGCTWIFFGCVCAARDSKLAPRSKKNSPKIDTPF